jgi:hypothetical protein
MGNMGLLVETAQRSEYLDFTLIHDTGKTQTYGVDSRSGGHCLAIIKWYGAWRQYTLFPEPDTIWNKTCLRDVIAFIDSLMEARKK